MAKKKQKVKQGYIDPDMAPAEIPEIDKAADAYVDARDARMNALTEEMDRKAILKGIMVKHGQKEYEYDGKIVTLDGEPDVKVRKKKAPKEDKSE